MNNCRPPTIRCNRCLAEGPIAGGFDASFPHRPGCPNAGKAPQNNRKGRRSIEAEQRRAAKRARRAS